MEQPLDHAVNRATPLSFGVYVTSDPDHNPIDPPERFTGYHVGLDYEVSRDELEQDVPVYAICSGTVAYSGSAEGYGGLLIQRCTIDGQDATVLYGHLSSSDLPHTGADLSAGERIGLLAPARSGDSGGNRKHLHLGIHRGTEIETLGYVQTEGEIAQFLDPKVALPRGINQVLGRSLTPYWQQPENATPRARASAN